MRWMADAPHRIAADSIPFLKRPSHSPPAAPNITRIADGIVSLDGGEVRLWRG